MAQRSEAVSGPSDHAKSTHPEYDREDAFKMLEEMAEALQLESQAAAKEDRQATVTLRSGVYRGPYQSRRMYEFPVPGACEGWRAGDSVHFSMDTMTGRARVARVTDSEILLATKLDLGRTNITLDVRPDTAWIPQRVGEELEEVQKCLEDGRALGGRFCLDTAMRVLGRGAFHAGRDDVPSSVFHENGPDGEKSLVLNGSQRDAVKVAVGSNAAFIWGPPGTGKTMTLARVVEAHYRRGDTVLAVAPSNQAADLLAHRVASRIEQEPDFQSGLVLRPGAAATRKLDKKFRDLLDPDHIAERLHGDKGGTGQYKKRVLDRARVIVTTAHYAILSPDLDRLYDVTVIDEASMLQLPLVFLTAGRAQHSAVVAGDFLQLPPVVRSGSPACNEWLGKDVFEFSGIVEDVRRGDTIEYLEVLDRQYRMHDEICQVANEVFYDHRLQTDVSLRHRDPLHPLPSAISVLDTAALTKPAARAEKTSSNSRRNAVHVGVVDDLLTYLLRDFDGAIDHSRDEVAVLTPFAAQASVLRSSIRGKGYPSSLVPVSTVHACQGEEYDTVILDLVDAPGEKVSKFLKAYRPEHDGTRVLNVALTRAMRRIIVVAHLQYMHDRGGTVVKELLRHCWQRSPRIDLEDILTPRL